MQAQTIDELLGNDSSHIIAALEEQAKKQGYASVRELLMDIAKNFSTRCSSTSEVNPVLRA